MGCTGSKSSSKKSDVVEVPAPQVQTISVEKPPQKKKPPALTIGKVDSNRSLNSGNDIDDIQVNIPDPFRSQYKDVEVLSEKGFLKTKRGVSRDRQDVLVETTDINEYHLAGYSDIAYFERLDILRRIDYICIPPVLDFYDNQDMYRIVFAYPPGKDFASLLVAKGAMAPQVRWNILSCQYNLMLCAEFNCFFSVSRLHC
jgi:hypothetical protein